MTEQTPTDALAQLRHLYANLTNGGVRDTASAKRVAEGLLSPAIAALERATPQPTQAQAGAVPLTDEQIHAIYDEVARREPYAGAVTRRSIVRAIEAAHGIKGGQHGTE